MSPRGKLFPDIRDSSVPVPFIRFQEGSHDQNPLAVPVEEERKTGDYRDKLGQKIKLLNNFKAI